MLFLWIWALGAPVESFEDPAKFELTGTGQYQVSREHATDGSQSIRFESKRHEDAVDIRPRGRRWDLSQGEKLQIDVFNAQSVRSLVDVKFFSNKTYLVQQLSVPPGASTVELDLQGVRAHLDASQVTILKFQANDPGQVFFLDNVRTGAPLVAEPQELPVAPRLTTPANVLPNGDLDAGLVGFDFWSSEGLYFQRAITGEGVKSGTAAFHFDFQKPESNGKSSAFVFSGFTPFEPGEYDFSLWLRSEMPGRCRWYWAFESDADRDAVTGTYWTEPFDTKTSWTEQTGRFRVSRPVSLRLYVAVYSPTDFFLDAIQVTKKGTKPPVIRVEGNQLWIDDESRHVVGIYHGCPKKVAELGIQHHKPDTFPNKDYVAVCQERGIWVWGDLSGCVRAGLTQPIRQIRDIYSQPNLVGFYSDEPDHEGKFAPPDLLRRVTKDLKPFGLPHWAVVMSWPMDSSNAFQYQDSVDIISTDIYPWANRKPLSWLLRKVDDFLRTDPSRPRWVVVEAHRSIPADYQRAMIWLPFVAGADGTWFWEMDDIGPDGPAWDAFKANMKVFLNTTNHFPGRATRLALPDGLVGSIRKSRFGGQRAAVLLNLTDMPRQVTLEEPALPVDKRLIDVPPYGVNMVWIPSP